MDSVTFTDEEGEDLVLVLTWAINEGIGYGHTLPGEPEYEEADRKRRAILAKIERPLKRSRARKRAASSLASRR